MWWLPLALTVLLNGKGVMSALPPSRCHEISSFVFSTICTHCPYNVFIPCPSGSRKLTVGMGMNNCILSVGWRPILGCVHMCEQQFNKSDCCPDFWGKDCRPCPAVASNKQACYGNGNCSDFLAGNGTCHCADGFEGFACEMCSDKSKFGDNCQKNCTCKNGNCLSGVLGNGTCEPFTCRIGYYGQNCELFEDACKKSCRKNSHCVMLKGIAECRCNPGYIKIDTSYCEVVNPCKKSSNLVSCPSNSDCHFTEPGRHKCVCAHGYTGDGLVCSAIDYCQYNNGNCASNMTCNYQGPGKFNCSCLPGYGNYVEKLGCSMVDLCVSAGCADINAVCYMVKAGQKACRCKSGYVGNGTICYGNILQRIDDLNRDGQYRNKLTLVKSLITRHSPLARPFAGAGPFTVFIPTNDGLYNNVTASQRSRIFNDAELSLHLILSHSVFGYLTTNEFAENGNLTTLKGSDAIVTNDTNFFYQLRGQPIKSKIITTDIIASNGIIHILELPAWIPSITAIRNTSSLTLWQVINQKSELQTLQEFIQIAGMRSELEIASTQGITFIAPNNEAFKTLASNVTEFLKSLKGRVKLKAILRNHIYEKKINIIEMIYKRTFMSRATTLVTVSVKDQGTVILGGTAKLVETNIPTSNGILYVTNGLLIPLYIKPIVRKQCKLSPRYAYSGCSNCRRTVSNDGCPQGFESTGQRYRCWYGRFSHGCRTKCTARRCCSGFYGPNCLACPGAIEIPCYGNGKCFEGISGNGTCICKRNFTGTACELCKDPGTFGPSCDKMCTCVRGVCNDGRYGNGSCLPHTCKNGYYGNDCTATIQKCGHRLIPCSMHALCVLMHGPDFKRYYNPRCLCKVGYSGDGVNCYEIDPCETANGGCHRNALCTKTGPGTKTCTCIAGWTGDGTYCGPIDYCATPSRGYCHKYAKCIFVGPGQTRCECLPGYAGYSGWYCKEINSCLINNGNCSPFGKCIRSNPGLNNCTCRFGYTGDGYTCLPSIAVVMMNRKELKTIYRLIAKSNLLRFLTSPKTNSTVFVASDSAMNKLNASEKAVLVIPKNLYYYGGSNVALGIYNSTSLKNISYLPSLFSNVFINISVSNTSKLMIGGEAEVIVSDIRASNGIIHIVNKVLLPPFYFEPPNEVNLYQGLCVNQSDFTEICAFIKKHGLESTLKNCTHCTIFAPNDGSFNDMKLHHQKFSLKDLQFHITEHYILPSSIQKAQQFSTLAGQYYVLLLEKNHETIKVNGFPITYVGSAYKWVIYNISSVLKPVRNVCFRTPFPLTTSCGPCYRRNCPRGYRHIRFVRCRGFPRRIPRQSFWCRSVCQKPLQIRECCTGFWGKFCDACPGEYGKPCFGNGVCNGHTGACSCNRPFRGVACEKCYEGHYGENCKHCNCKNGATCDTKNGFCYCLPNWKGLHCQNNVTHSMCDNTTCHQYASCNNTTTMCQCDYGYTGNGTNCKHFNFCKRNNGGCSPYAKCIFDATSGNTNCVCKNNYLGDGVFCQGKNLCRNETVVDCHSNANCIYLSPGRFKCDCKAGYSGDGKKSCSLINICLLDNGGCSIYAKCTFDKHSLLATCHCRKGYDGNGTVCIGNLMESLITNPELTEFFSRLKNAIIQDVLSSERNFSIIAPNNNAFTSLSPRKRRSIADVSEIDLKYYIVSCVSITEEDVKAAGKSFISVAGSWLNITSPRVINDNINILSIRETHNGGILIVDKMINVSVRSLSNSNMSFIDAARKNGYGKFVQFITDAGMRDIVSNRHYQPFTMFWPTDDAIDRLPADIKARIVSGNYNNELRKILNYHIISKTKITTKDILSYSTGLSRRTKEGESLFISCKGQKGDLYINDRSRIVQRDIPFLEGIAFGISEVLLPHGVAGRCDEIKYEKVKGSCAFCNETGLCPPGTILQGVDQTSTCYHQKIYLGCTSRCLRRIKQKMCCKNFYGQDCQGCPGDVRNPCSGRGHCTDGLNGNGSCLCQKPYYGDACERCTNASCGIFAKTCNSRKNPCSVFAFCDSSKPQLCSCIAGYEGDGFYCQEIDPCQRNNGECNEHAICTYLGPNSTMCRCRPGYIGNGHNCVALPPSHPCATNNGNCNIHANCDEKDGDAVCTCGRDFVGDGAFCGGSLMQVINDIEDISEFAKMFRMLVYGVEGNRIIRLLSSEAMFTVFAPINYGFTAKKLTIEELKSHIVREKFTLKSGRNHTFLSLARNNITVLKMKNKPFRTNNIAVVLADYPASNGIIHVIDHVLPYIKPPPVVPVMKSTPTPLVTTMHQNNTEKHGTEKHGAEKHNNKRELTTIGISVGVSVFVLIIIVVVVIFVKKRRHPASVRYNKNFESIMFTGEDDGDDDDDDNDDNDDDDDYQHPELQHPSTENEETCVTNPTYVDPARGLDENLEMTETSCSLPLTEHDDLNFNKESTSNC